MACEALQLSGWIDGEDPIDTSGTDHVAGQPAKLVSTGVALALLPADVCGIFKNDMRDEVRGGPSAADVPAAGFSNASVVKGYNKLKLTPGLLKTGVAQSPFLYPGAGTWVKGKHLYVSAAGFWDNQPASANDPPFGVVTKIPASATDSLEADMFSSAPFYSAVTT